MSNDFSAVAARIKGIPAAAERALGGAVIGAAEICADAARALVPVDSGELRGSIAAIPDGNLRAAVTASAGHAAWVEYGTSRMAPQPYMLPAAQSARTAFVDLASSAVRGAMRGN